MIQHLWESRAIYEYIADVFGLLPTGDAFARADAMSFIHSLNEVFDRISGLGVSVLECGKYQDLEG